MRAGARSPEEHCHACPKRPSDPAPARPSPADLWAGFAALLAAHARGPAHLTKRGLALVHRVLAVPPGAAPAPPSPAPAGPHWDRMRRRLWLDGREIRTFRRMAPRQMAVLDACQAGGWGPDGVVNPFERALGAAAARRRLHETVTNLNRRLQGQGLRVREDGDRVWWERTGGGRGPTRKYA